jgi:hypothetical protein
MDGCKVNCKDCGFLAVRECQTRQMVEVELKVRETWVVPKHPTVQGLKWHEELPFCFAHAADLPGEIGSFNVPAVLKVIGEDRTCESFTPWQHGYSPREHAEMVHFKQMEKLAEERNRTDKQLAEERKKADEERAEQRRREDQRWQAQQRAEQQEWQASENRKTRRLTTFIAISGAILTVIGYLVGKSGR